MTRVRIPIRASFKMEEQQNQGEEPQKGKWYNRHYKLLLLLPLAILIFSFIYMVAFYQQHGDFIHKDISLTGGTTITISEKINIEELKQALSGKLDDINVREVYDLITREQKAVIIETKNEGCNESQINQIKNVLEGYLGYQLIDGENSSFECTGSTLGASFYKQLLIAILIAFVFMAAVVFIIFRTFVPSAAVILSAFADILMTLVFVNILGLKMSTAGIVAFLMLIGYSVDTDILLNNRLLKRTEGSINERIYGAFKTGITMTLTSLVAIGVALLVVRSFSAVLTQIFTILVIGLGFDIFNTWITNASIIKWYVEKRK